MPGLDQLKQFSEDVANLGNELTIREERGEPIIRVPFPVNISEEDDSDDFVLGMPLQNDSIDSDDTTQNDDLSAEGLRDSSPVDYSNLPELDSILNPEPVEALDFSDFPELDAILNPSSQGAAEELSAVEPLEPVEDFTSGGGLDFTVDDEDDNEVSLDLPSFDNLGGDSSEKLGAFDSNNSFNDLDIPDFTNDLNLSNSGSADSTGGFDLPDFDVPNASPDFTVDDGDDNEVSLDLPSFDNLGGDSSDNIGDLDLPDFGSTDTASDLDLPDFGSTDTVSDLDLPDFGSTDAASDLDLPDFGSTDTASDLDLPDFGSTDATSDLDLPDFGSTDTAGDLDLPDFGSTDTASDLDLPDFGSTDTAGGFDLPDFGSTDTASDLPDFGSTDTTGEGDVPNFGSSDNSDEVITPSDEEDRSAIDFGSDGPAQVDTDFATRPVHDADFHTESGTEDESSGEGMDSFVPETHEIFDAPDDPFDGEEPPPDENFDDFVIPGISDQAAGMVMSKPKRPSIMGKDGKKEKNTLTDKEYETFLKNLRDYPLNLRVELEKFVVGDEFKDDVVYDVIQKVIKKTSARQLATHLEKLLDISIPVPREFERRTATQYEEYKKSAEYQLKNKILPIAIISVMAACIMYIIFLFGQNFIYEPLKANSLYKEGYALLDAGAYPQSEMKFNEALEYQQQKRWFFTYADGYRKHKQYERARMMYKAGLQRFKQDKALGLDYAEMELYDLRNFENAEIVVRREVLDYHINDSDGLLLLGDIFLEWGDERDESKYEQAKEVYDELLELYGQKDVYLARLMRYYIRVDDLRNVLQMKEYFYPKKDALNGQDLIELSGYLLDKSTGNIAPADEYLLSSIEDVRELLERAVEAAPNEPESLYNMGLYFVNANNSTLAKDWLSAALTSFENASYKPRKRLLRQLNTFRILGDLDMENKEYISAEEKYRMGISLFEKEAEAGLVGDRNVGQLYASLADINYLIIGDYDEALRNYTIASQTQYATPSVYYKMGYINYSQKKYGDALKLFIKTADETPSDTHVLYALGNVLSSRGDNFAAQGYYQRLMDILEQQRTKYTILFPQVNEEHEEIVEMYKMGANNLGVTLYRLSRQTGNSSMNAEALTNFTASLRAHDALERNQETLVRKAGTNLAEQNIKYMSQALPEFEPSIYTEIPALPEGESLPK